MRNRALFATFAMFSAALALSDEPRFDVLCSADGDGATGGGAPPPVVPPAAPATPPAPPAATPPAAVPAPDLDAIKSEQRAAALKEMGFADEAAFKADQKARKEAADAKLSESERNQKALKEALDARGEAEAEIEKQKAENKGLRDKIAMRDKLDEHGVAPKERLIAETLYTHAKAAKDFDEAKYFEDLRKERPYLFGSAAAAVAPPANTTASPPAGGSPFGVAPPAADASFDAMKATPAQVAAWRRSNHV